MTLHIDEDAFVSICGEHIQFGGIIDGRSVKGIG
jgi:hypothetical protein